MFYLYVDGTRAPRVPHETLEEARLEAERLAIKERRNVLLYALVEVVNAPQDGAPP